MKNLLITGFEPFGDQGMNPSWEAVKALPDAVEGVLLTKMQLPVVFGKAACLAIEKAEVIGADAIIMVGLAGGRDAVTPEMVGINLRHAAIGDNEGNQPLDERIAEGAPDAFFSTLPVRRMAEAISKAGISAKVSYSAGTYVCNDILFTVLNHFKDSPVRACFIHVPYTIGQKEGAPEFALSDLVCALTVAIGAIDE